jgi:glycosyltransferase involved in cell wall biosynthesis
MKYSVIVPIYEEEGNIKLLDKELRQTMDKLGSYEVIYIDDGSTDYSLNELKKLKKTTIISLNRNYGQSIALDAGFKESQGDIIISIDGDLQNDPKDIPKLLEKLEKDNLDVVAGWRKDRKDKTGIKLLTKTGRLLRSLIISDNVHDSGCTLRVYRKEAAKSLDLWGEMHRYILSLLRWKGFTIGEVIVNHRPRTNGKTKYNYTKAHKGFVDLIYIWFLNKYSNRPLHIFGGVGLLSSFTGMMLTLFSIYQKIAQNLPLNRSGWFFLGFFLIIIGIIFFCFGILMDITIRTNLNTSPVEKRYYVREIVKR